MIKSTCLADATPLYFIFKDDLINKYHPFKGMSGGVCGGVCCDNSLQCEEREKAYLKKSRWARDQVMSELSKLSPGLEKLTCIPKGVADEAIPLSEYKECECFFVFYLKGGEQTIRNLWSRYQFNID